MTDRVPLTILVPTGNEEANIGNCLATLQFGDELLVVDSFSKDRTVEIAKEAGARVLEHEYLNSAAQKNWALPKTAHRWVLIVDSDERVTPPLRDEILDLLQTKPPCSGYFIRRKNHFLNRQIRYCGWQRDKVLRLFDRDRVRYEEREVHAKVLAPGTTPTLRGQLLHYTFRTFGQYWRKMERYSDWGASELHRRGEQAGFKRILLHPAARFFKMYVMQQGFRDGMHGLVLCMLGAFTVFLKYAKLWEYSVSASPRGCPS